jgi:3D (Asp-Asp-Asp) domain-containing protein
MVRNQRILLIPLAALILFLAVYFIYNGQKQPTPQPPRKPVPEKQSETSEANWYIEFSVKDQKATAYTEAANAPVSSAGREYFIGSGAVHPRYPIHAGGEARSPIIPFGTTLYLQEPVNVQGQQYTELTVNDTGDVHYGLWPSHPYWVDIYFGTTNYYNQQSASQAGVKLIDYKWYEPWPDQ